MKKSICYISARTGDRSLLMSRIILFVSTLFLLSVLHSCRKDESLIKEPAAATAEAAKNGVSRFARSSDFNDFPENDHGMLRFRDGEHMMAYINFLDVSTTYPEGEKDGTSEDPDDILEGIESSRLGFTSLRHITEAAFQQLNEAGWATPEEIPERHFIYDIALKSILNANADVRVGDKITHYINKDFSATVDASEQEKIEMLHNLPLDATLMDVFSLDPTGEVIEIGYMKRTNFAKFLQRRSGTGTIGYEGMFNVDRCNSPKKMQLGGLNYSLNGQMLAADFTIFWGDGTTTNISSGSGSLIIDVDHLYPQFGNFTITIRAKCVSCGTTNLFDAAKSISVFVPTQCNYGKQDSKQEDIRDNMNMNRIMKCYAVVQQLPSTYCRVYASTWSYHLEANRWRESRIDEVGAGISTTTFAADCITSTPVDLTSSNGNTKNSDAGISGSYWVGWYQVISHHKIRVGSNVFIHDMRLRPSCL